MTDDICLFATARYVYSGKVARIFRLEISAEDRSKYFVKESHVLVSIVSNKELWFYDLYIYVVSVPELFCVSSS